MPEAPPAEVPAIAPTAVASPQPIPPPETDHGPRFRWSPGLRWEYWHENTTAFPVDAQGTNSGLRNTGFHRLRLSPTFAWVNPRTRADGTEEEVPWLDIHAEFDFLAGPIYGDMDRFNASERHYLRRDRRYGRDSVDFRQLWLGWRSPWFLLRVGQMTSQWGLGILANDGAPEPERFGVKRYGDRVERILLATKPFQPLGPGFFQDNFIVSAGFDVVFKDEFADLTRGDLGLSGVFALALAHPDYFDGFYFAYRHLKMDDGDKLESFALSLAGKNRPTLLVDTTGCEATLENGQPNPTCVPGGFRVQPFLNYELSLIFGNTTLVRTENAPEGLDITSFGAVVQAGLALPDWGFEMALEVGHASGDANAYDDKSKVFYFDPDYKVGLVLFDLPLNLISARAVDRLSDPHLVGVPQQGLELSNTLGRVTNANYLFPTLKFRPTRHIFLMVGGLWAWSATRNIQNYETYVNGGAPTNAYGRRMQARRDDFLGFELDSAMEVELPLPWLAYPEAVGFFLRLEHGVLFPGLALAQPNGQRLDPIHKVLASFSFRWR